MTHELQPWLQILSRLRVSRSHGTPAPHKPLLILSILDQIEQNILKTHAVALTPELAFQFLGYWQIVAARGRALGRVELPFFHLQNDGLLRLVAHPGLEGALKSIRATSVEALNRVVAYGELPSAFFQLMQHGPHRALARRVLISGNWFLPTEQIALASLLDLSSDMSEIAMHTAEVVVEAPPKIGRDIRFRLQIVPLYGYACALCGVKMLLPSGMTLVEAAHIQPFARSHNDEVTNGLALCRNHHWAFDVGLWSAGDDFRVIVAAGHFLEAAPQQRELRDFHGQFLRTDGLTAAQHPDPKRLAWHRKHVYGGDDE